MLNYKFRDATQDFDVILKTVSGVKDVIAKFADENDLPRDWMNSEFMKGELVSKNNEKRKGISTCSYYIVYSTCCKLLNAYIWWVGSVCKRSI